MGEGVLLVTENNILAVEEVIRSGFSQRALEEPKLFYRLLIRLRYSDLFRMHSANNCIDTRRDFSSFNVT